MTINYPDYIEEQAEIERRRLRQEAYERFVPVNHPPGCSCESPECPEWQAIQSTT